MTEDDFQWIAIFLLAVTLMINIIGEWLADRR